MKRRWIGIVALTAGIVALSLAVIPPIAIGQPAPVLDQLLDDGRPNQPQANQPQAEPRRPLIGFDANIEVTFGKDGEATEPAREGEVDEDPGLKEKAKDFLKSFAIKGEVETKEVEKVETDEDASVEDARSTDATEADSEEEGIPSKIDHGFKASVGQDNEATDEDDAPEAAQVAAAPQPVLDPKSRLANAFIIASAAVALAGILFGILAYHFERKPGLAIGAIACSCAALRNRPQINY